MEKEIRRYSDVNERNNGKYRELFCSNQSIHRVDSHCCNEVEGSGRGI